MFHINDNFTKLPAAYLFSEVARRINAYTALHPDAEIIRMGIGDVTRPIVPAVINALHKAVDDEGAADTFHGYGPEQGYEFLTSKIAEYDYKRHGVDISIDEIFVSDGAKCDTGNIGDILSVNNRVCVTDPVYPVYVDTNVMGGRAGNLLPSGRWDGIEYLPCTEENDFVPSLPKITPDVVYLCYPNNPTGTALTRAQLKVWVDYCRANGVLLLFDSAYEAFITSPDVPHSIYEIEGARECAIEFRSFSKTAGFTGLRLGYTVVPIELCGMDSAGKRVPLNGLWRRRQTTKFNGAGYLTQRGATGIYTPEGQKEIRANIDYYMTNASYMLAALKEAGIHAYGGVDSPYVWFKVPDGLTSWEMFDRLLSECNVAGTPGSGFGHSGEGYFRLTAFNTLENTRRAMDRIRTKI